MLAPLKPCRKKPLTAAILEVLLVVVVALLGLERGLVDLDIRVVDRNALGCRSKLSSFPSCTS